MEITLGDMFAGVGGIALGFEQVGINSLWANEFDESASETYKANFNHKLLVDDVKKVDTNKLPKVDIITAGFPCQSFSIAGRREGFEDPRGNLFFEVARFINDLKPKAFLLENVKNLAGHDNGNTLKVIKETLVEDLGYTFKSFILSAYKHGNIPQARERIYMVGFRKDLNIDMKKFKVPKEKPLTKKISACLLEGKQDNKYYFKDDHKYMPKLREVMISKDTLYQWRRVYVRENKQSMCPTLTANMGMGGHNVPLLVDDFGFRRLTPRECFNFQGFPKHFVLPKGLVDSKLYKQAGNSVTVPVIRRIAGEFKRLLG